MATTQDPFRSARLLYRAVRPEDDSFFARINHDRIGYVNSNASNIHLPRPSDAERFRKSMDDNLLSAIICLQGQVFPGGVLPCPEKDCTPIGQIHLNGIPPRMMHHRSTEIGIDILPAYQGQGYGSEAIRWVLEYAFKRAGLHKVRIRAFGWNERACKLYQKLGFVLEGRERESLWHEGRFWDGIEYGMIDREWWALQEEEKQEKVPENPS